MIFAALLALLWAIIMPFHYVIFNWNNETRFGNARHKEQGYRHMLTFFCTGRDIDCLELFSDKTWTFFILLLSFLLFKAVKSYSWLSDLFKFIIMSQFYLVEEVLLCVFETENHFSTCSVMTVLRRSHSNLRVS